MRLKPQNYYIEKSMKMRCQQVILMFILMVVGWGCKHNTETQIDKVREEASYSVPKIKGNYRQSKEEETGGVKMGFESAILYPDSSQSELIFKWDSLSDKSFNEGAYFRLTLDSDLNSRQKFLLFTEGNELIDSMDISLGTPFQLVQCKIQGKYLSDVLKNGLKVRLKGKGGPVGVFTHTALGLDNFLPHILIPGETSPREEFYKRMASIASLTEYGWQEGCVIDGIAKLSERAADGTRYKNSLEKHMSLIFPNNDSINHNYEKIGIEFTSCLAQLALWKPEHPEIEHVLNFWESKTDSAGVIKNGNTIVAEGNYTVAWPLAVISQQLNKPELADIAISQLRFRRDYLIDKQGAIWLRYNLATQERTFRLWSRGLTWYVLGLAKTLDVLPNPPQDLIEELQRATDYLISIQGEDGLWSVFAGDSLTAPETSGTCGIGTAMAIGVRRGWLGKNAKASALLALQGVEKRLTADGYLDGVAEENKGGVAFQRETKGSICNWGMGLFAQLLAELDPPKH